MDSGFRASTLSETRGFLKALVELNGDRILGFTLLESAAAESWRPCRSRWRGVPLHRAARHDSDSPDLVEGLVPVVFIRAFTAKNPPTRKADRGETARRAKRSHSRNVQGGWLVSYTARSSGVPIAMRISLVYLSIGGFHLYQCRYLPGQQTDPAGAPHSEVEAGGRSHSLDALRQFNSSLIALSKRVSPASFKSWSQVCATRASGRK